MLVTEPCTFPAQGKNFFSKISVTGGLETNFNFSPERISEDNAFLCRRQLTNNSLLESNKRESLPKKIVKTTFAVSNASHKKAPPISEALPISNENVATNSDYVSNSADLFFSDQTRDEKLCDTEEEERNLILASVKHVDCQDFPFEEVLSLENTVQKSSLSGEDMRHRVSNTILQCKGKPISAIPSGDLSLKNKEAFISKEPNLTLVNTTKKHRRPFLKCSTWPKSDYYDETLTENFSENPCKSSTDANGQSKLDSPSFYSSSAIDFSAISHLSEEHDKIMAQENSKISSKNPTFISHTTKEKLYGKATQKSANWKARRESNKMNIETSCTTSGENFNQSLLTDVNPADLNRNTVTRTSIGETSSKKTPKSSVSSLEKAFRKRYASASAVSVSSVPLSTLQTDTSPLIITTQHLPSSENSLQGEIKEGSKNLAHIIVEKQPLPPEGFKISRYPILEKSQGLQQSSSTDDDDGQNPLGSNDLHKIIDDLRQQLDRAERRINEVERQAREWKETAQQTLRAAQVIKAQLDSQKDKRLHETRADETRLSSKSVIPRRWSNEENLINKPVCKVSRSRYVSTDTARNNLCPTEQSDRTRGSKRVYPFENNEAPAPKNKVEGLSEPSTTVMKMPNPEKNKSLLEWLANTGSDEDGIDYMTYLETPDTSIPYPTANVHNNTIMQRSESKVSHVGKIPDVHSNATLQRSLTHAEVRKALREKVGGSRTNLTEENPSTTPLAMPQKLPLATPNSLDQQFLEDFPFSEHEINQSMEVFNTSELLKQSEALASETSHSDSELHTRDICKKSNTQAKLYLSRRQSNSESNLTKTFTSEITYQERAFFNQLDSILDL